MLYEINTAFKRKMELIVIIVMCIIILSVLCALILNFTPKKIKLIKQIGDDKELNEITNKLPENEEICREMLAMLKNETVNVKTGNETSEASLYIVATDSILIANIKNTFTRVQTIAHECLHSVQDKKLLWFNFVFSNAYMVYFFIITVLSLFNKLNQPNIFAIILIMMSFLLFFVRSYLETDAMTKARFLAKEYMQNKIDVVSKENIDVVVENYDRLNDIGIKLTNFSLLAGYLVKVIIFCIVSIV